MTSLLYRLGILLRKPTKTFSAAGDNVSFRAFFKGGHWHFAENRSNRARELLPNEEECLEPLVAMSGGFFMPLL